MQKLNTRQIAVLDNAARRSDGQLLPLPDGMQLKGGGLAAMLRALERRGLAERSADDAWMITKTGRAAVAGQGRAEVNESKDEKKAPRTAKPELDEVDTGSMPLFRPGTRQAQLLDLLQRGEGADIDEMVQFTGWQTHSVRAVLTGFRKRGIEVSRTKEGNGVSVYRATLPANVGGMAA